MKTLLKRCPACGRTYADRTFSHCEEDGRLLSPPYDPDETQILSDSAFHEIMPENHAQGSLRSESKRQGSSLLFVALVMATLLIGFGLLFWLQTRTTNVPAYDFAADPRGKTNLRSTQPEKSAPPQTSAGKQSEQTSLPLIITSPSNGAEVGYTDTVMGSTELSDRKHYIIVTPLNKQSWAWPASVATDGSLSGSVQFGEGLRGMGESFEVRILATMSNVTIGVFDNQPKDAQYSKPVTVTRTK